MRIIIAGSRGFNDYDRLKQEVFSILNELMNEGFSVKREDIEIVSGTARGADQLGERFAAEYKLKLKRMPANWNKYGRKAGPLRNEEMAKYAKQDKEVGILIAFWDGESRGTHNMINLAKEYGLRVFVVRF